MKQLITIIMGMTLSCLSYAQPDSSQKKTLRLKEEAQKLKQVSLKKYQMFINQTIELLDPRDTADSQSESAD